MPVVQLMEGGRNGGSRSEGREGTKPNFSTLIYGVSKSRDFSSKKSDKLLML